MIEVKDVKYDPTEKVEICAERMKELVEIENATLKFYKLLTELVIYKYTQNYACFGNGGGFTCEELAELLSIDLPKVEHIGMDEYFKQREVAKNG